MSTKLYGGRRIVFPETPGKPWGFNLVAWQAALFALRDQLAALAKKHLEDEYLDRAVYRLDRDTVGLPAEDSDKSHLGFAWSSIDEEIRRIDKGLRNPLLDTEVTLCWQLLPDQRTVLVILYAERPDLRAMVEEELGLEDYHFQNQCDPPDGCTWEEMQARGKVWEAALDDWNNPPVARFHSFELSPAPTHPPLLGWGPDPVLTPRPLDERAHAVAFDLLLEETRGEETGRDLLRLLLRLRREVREGGPMFDRLAEITENVGGKLIPDPTLEHLRQKPTKSPE